jgi:hypothetical protein
MKLFGIMRRMVLVLAMVGSFAVLVGAAPAAHAATTVYPAITNGGWENFTWSWSAQGAGFTPGGTAEIVVSDVRDSRYVLITAFVTTGPAFTFGFCGRPFARVCSVPNPAAGTFSWTSGYDPIACPSIAKYPGGLSMWAIDLTTGARTNLSWWVAPSSC